MIALLDKFDPRTAVGILARAALALEGTGNPAAEPKIPDEEIIRNALLREARTRLGIELRDNRPEVLERLGDWLDQESDRLIGPPDIKSALARLAAAGTLPSDLYQLNFIPQVMGVYGQNFDFERRLIEKTVRSPDQEYHYGAPVENEPTPAMVSLFARDFKTPWPFKNFMMLVCGMRDSTILHVHQAWRIYPSLFNIKEANTLVDVLRCFADYYRGDITIDGKRGHFFLYLDRTSGTTLNIPSKPPEIIVSQFIQHDATGSMKATLVVAINLDQYRASLKRMAVLNNQIRGV
jgi:hypothetical protein